MYSWQRVMAHIETQLPKANGAFELLVSVSSGVPKFFVTRFQVSLLLRGHRWSQYFYSKQPGGLISGRGEVFFGFGRRREDPASTGNQGDLFWVMRR